MMYTLYNMKALCVCVCVCVCAQLLGCVLHFVTIWTLAHQAPLPMEFSRQEYWNEVSLPRPRDLPDPGTESTSFASPALAAVFFTPGTTWEAQCES